MTCMTERASGLVWALALTRPGQERRAAAGLAAQGFGTFLPRITVTRRRQGRFREEEVPLFPGYLFISAEVGCTRWSVIDGTRGIRYLLRAGRQPARVRAELVLGLMARCDPTGLLAPASSVGVGDSVRILSGPFAEFVAQVEGFGHADRVRLLVDLMGRRTRIDLPPLALALT